MTTTATKIDKYDDLIDIRDVIARFEELETESENWGSTAEEVRADYPNLADSRDEDLDCFMGDREEFETLRKLLDECCGNGGDEQWRGDWYPITLIRDDYFRTYAQDLAEDIGAINADATWPNNCIDWDKAARDLRMDYTAVDFDGVTYWTR